MSCRRYNYVYGYVALALVCSCASTTLEPRWAHIGSRIQLAEKNGARKCAPVELAMAESHHDFARQELGEGNYRRAMEELDVADRNAEHAIRKSPPARCTNVKPAPGDARGC